jgi:surface protein
MKRSSSSSLTRPRTRQALRQEEAEASRLTRELQRQQEEPVPQDLRNLILDYVPDMFITTLENTAEHGVTLAELLALPTDGSDIHGLPVVTLVTVRPIRLTQVKFPHLRRLEGDVSLYGDCSWMFQHNYESLLRLDSVTTSEVTDMRLMFDHSFFDNNSLADWDTHNVTNMSYMFASADSFDQNLSQWDTGAVTNMRGMFAKARAFNSALFRDTRAVTNMHGMFAGADSFDQDLSAWVIRQVTNITRMFQYAQSFNQDISHWNLNALEYYEMFRYQRQNLGDKNESFNKNR